MHYQNQNWYMYLQFEAVAKEDLDTVKLQPISLNLPWLKELEGRWLVEAVNYMN